jgi:hypothetical protein
MLVESNETRFNLDAIVCQLPKRLSRPPHAAVLSDVQDGINRLQVAQADVAASRRRRCSILANCPGVISMPSSVPGMSSK